MEEPQRHIKILIALAAVGALFIFGALIWRSVRSAQPTQVSTWGSTGTLIPNSFDPANYQKPENPFASLLGMQGNLGGTVPTQTAINTNGTHQPSEGSTAGTQVTQTEQPTETPERTSLTLQEIFSFLPWGAESYQPVVKQANEKPEQQELYSWANRVGGLIQDFENTHASMNTTFNRFFESRSADDAAAVRTIAADYSVLVEDINTIQPPESVAGLHSALADSYAAIGSGLETIANAVDDDTLLAAINAYSPAARAHTTTYLGIVDLLSINKVEFNPEDAGIMFVFNSTP